MNAQFVIDEVRVLLLLALVPLAIFSTPKPLHAQPWGSVRVVQDRAGHVEAILQNSSIYVRYGFRDTGTPTAPHPEGMITSFVLKQKHIDQAGQLLDAAAGRGELITAFVSHDGDDYKAIRLFWTNATTEVSIVKDQPVLRIDYLTWFVNIVDIGAVGGGSQDQDYHYAIYGAGRWPRKYIVHPNAYYDSVAGDDLTDNPDAPPNMAKLDSPDAGSLNYHGWFVMSVYNSKNGVGFGRVAPVDRINNLKLLFYKGFELFPDLAIGKNSRKHVPFTCYLFASTGGGDGSLRMGLKLADYGLGEQPGNHDIIGLSPSDRMPRNGDEDHSKGPSVILR